MTEKNDPVTTGLGEQMYLLVVDQTDEFEVALKYAAYRAKAFGVRVSLLYVMDIEDFQHWGGVQERMHQEYMEAAEKHMLQAAKVINDEAGMYPVLYLQSGGNVTQKILDIIESDRNITKFILGANPQTGSPGPLVSYFSGKGLSRLRVPLTIVPGNLDLD